MLYRIICNITMTSMIIYASMLCALYNICICNDCCKYTCLEYDIIPEKIGLFSCIFCGKLVLLCNMRKLHECH